MSIKFRTPKANYNPVSRQPRTKENPETADNLTPAWQFHRCDDSHAEWGWKKLSEQEYKHVIKQLCSFERMRWHEIKAASGGKAQGHGTNHHSLPIEGFTKSAQSRLRELKLDDIETLFSLRLDNMTRLYGIKDGRVLRFIWHDPFHGNAKGAYPTQK